MTEPVVERLAERWQEHDAADRIFTACAAVVAEFGAEIAAVFGGKARKILSSLLNWPVDLHATCSLAPESQDEQYRPLLDLVGDPRPAFPLVDALTSEELPLPVSARLHAFALHCESTGMPQFERASRALPVLLESALVSASQSWQAHFVSHLAAAMRLALQFRGALADQVEDTLDSLVESIIASEPFDRRLLDTARLAMDYDKRSRSYDATHVLETLVNALHIAAQHFVDGEQTSLADSAYDVAVDLLHHLSDTDTMLAVGMEGVEAVVSRAEAREGSLDRGVQFQMALERVKDLMSRLGADCPESVRQRHREIKKMVDNAFGKAPGEMKGYESRIEVPAGEIDRLYDWVRGASTAEGRITAVAAAASCPELEDVERWASSPEASSMFERIVGSQLILDERGRPSANLQTLEERQQQKIDRHLVQLARLSARLYTSQFVRRLEDEGLRFEPGDVVTAFRDAGLVSDDRASLLRTGVDALLTGRFVEATHLLVPQFEASVRHLYGAATKKDVREREAVLTASTLGDMLEDGEFRIHAGLKRMWAAIFVRPTGANLRNRLSHGLSSSAESGEASAWLVFQSLIQLLLVDPDDIWEPIPTDQDDETFRFRRTIPGASITEIKVVATRGKEPVLEVVNRDPETGAQRAVSLSELAPGNEEFLNDLASEIRLEMREGRFEDIWATVWELFAPFADVDEVEWLLEQKESPGYVKGVGWVANAEQKPSEEQEKAREETRLLERFAHEFFGYGSFDAEIWFIGMEEGGGATRAEIESRLQNWFEAGESALLDIREFGRFGGLEEHARWFEGSRPPLQRTWSRLIRLALTYRSLKPSRDLVRRYQRDVFAAPDGDECLLELLPLPSPSMGTWSYGEWFPHPWLQDRDAYRAHLLGYRIRRLRELIAEHQPAVVIFYGKTYTSEWSRVVDVETETFDERVIVPRDGRDHTALFYATERTLFAVIDHPASVRPHEYFEGVGALLPTA